MYVMNSAVRIASLLLYEAILFAMTLTFIFAGNVAQAQVPMPPEVTTGNTSNLTWYSATVSGNLTTLGDYASANVSFEWGMISGDLTQETTIQTMNSTGAFSANLSGLLSNTTYYFRAKASANVTVYGDELSFITAPLSDISITKSDSPDPVRVADILTYTIIIDNNGPDNATGVNVTDSLDASLMFISANTITGSYNHSGGIVSWNSTGMAATGDPSRYGVMLQLQAV